MSDKMYKKVEITGTSTQSLESAIQNAVTKVAETEKHLRWFELVETRGAIEGNKVVQWQVTIKVGIALED